MTGMDIPNLKQTLFHQMARMSILNLEWDTRLPNDWDGHPKSEADTLSPIDQDDLFKEIFK